MRYRIQGIVEGSFWEFVDNGIRVGAFKAKEGPGDEVGSGWVSMQDFSDSEFQGASYVLGNYITLSYRIDAVRIPARVIEMHFKRESKKLLEETGRQRLSSAQGRNLKETIKETLKAQSFPSIQVVDLVWDAPKEIVYVATLSPRLRERVEDHFKKSFGLTLLPMIPYVRAEQLLTNEKDRSNLSHIKPSSLVS
jgi:DNA recombination-dependent growth factor C